MTYGTKQQNQQIYKKIISLFHMTDKKIKHNTITRSIAKVDFATFLKVDFMLS